MHARGGKWGKPCIDSQSLGLKSGIAAATRPFPGIPCSDSQIHPLKSRITAPTEPKRGQSLQRLPNSPLKSRIAAGSSPSSARTLNRFHSTHALAHTLHIPQHPLNKPPRSPALAASSATSDKRWSERNIRYDPNGNLFHLERYQDNANMPQATLDFRYDGPKRVRYAYDSNGNITCDPLRCFEIRYNLLNLSAEVIGHDPEESATAPLRQQVMGRPDTSAL